MRILDFCPSSWSHFTVTASPDPLTTPPVYWTEVFSRPDARWFPVDPVRGITNKRKGFDPSPSSSNSNAAPPSTLFPQLYAASLPVRGVPATKVENRMVYVVAFEEDGYARDVTRRYAKEYAAKVAKVQGGSNAPNVGGGGKGRQAWWVKVVQSIERPYRLVRNFVCTKFQFGIDVLKRIETTWKTKSSKPCN